MLLLLLICFAHPDIKMSYSVLAILILNRWSERDIMKTFSEQTKQICNKRSTHLNTCNLSIGYFTKSYEYIVQIIMKSITYLLT